MTRRKQKKQRGHYCRQCGRIRANEKFSGRGHARHICKDCERVNRAKRRQTAPSSAARLEE